MAIPGFTADCSVGSISTKYYLSSGNHHRAYWQIILQNQRMLSTEKFCILESSREPIHSGRKAWRDLESACYNLQCKKCREDCLSFINGLHDAVNIKLGKPMRTPNDFIYLREYINKMSKRVFGW
jgi:hypothetical protein